MGGDLAVAEGQVARPVIEQAMARFAPSSAKAKSELRRIDFLDRVHLIATVNA